MPKRSTQKVCVEQLKTSPMVMIATKQFFMGAGPREGEKKGREREREREKRERERERERERARATA